MVSFMVKATMDIRTKAVLFCVEHLKSVKDICTMYDISERTLRRWKKLYITEGLDGLKPRSTAPKMPARKISRKLENRVIHLKQKHPGWGARRIKYQYNLPVHWNTVHNIIRKHGFLIRIKAKPQPCRRFQRKHVDSLWQGDTFEFRIMGVGKVYVTGFTDDCSRYRIISKSYLHKSRNEAINALQWALKKRRKPKQIYLDNGKQFIAKDFKKEAEKHNIKLIYGRPYNAKGRGKIEAYHKILNRDLISQITFESLSHFRKELWMFDQRYNNWRRQQIHNWKTPADIYNNEKYFNDEDKNNLKSGHKCL